MKCVINHNIMFSVLVLNLNVLIWNRIKKQQNYICVGLSYYLIKYNDI